MNKEKLAVFCVLILLMAQGSCFSAGEEKGWEPYYFGSSTAGGLLSEKKEEITLSFDRSGAFGVYKPDKFSGTFDAQAVIKQGKGPCGMIIFKDNNGRLDPSNFVGIERKQEGGGNTVRVFAIRDGHDLKQGTKWDTGSEANALRITGDEKEKRLHFYYKCGKEDWVEFSTLPDWDNRAFYLYPYVKSNGDFTAKAVFIKPVVIVREPQTSRKTK